MVSGVATRPPENMQACRDKLSSIMYRSGTLMQPIFVKATQGAKRIIHAEGEQIRVLRGIEVETQTQNNQAINSWSTHGDRYLHNKYY